MSESRSAFGLAGATLPPEGGSLLGCWFDQCGKELDSNFCYNVTYGCLKTITLCRTGAVKATGLLGKWEEWHDTQKLCQ